MIMKSARSLQNMTNQVVRRRADRLVRPGGLPDARGYIARMSSGA